MARTRTLLDWLVLDQGYGQPRNRQIYEQIRNAVVSERVAAGTALPASRSLAVSLGVSRITILQAYDQLIAEGFLESRRGSGTRVASLFADDAGRRHAIAASICGKRVDATATIQLPGSPPVRHLGPAFQPSTPSRDCSGRGCCNATGDGSTRV